MKSTKEFFIKITKITAVYMMAAIVLIISHVLFDIDGDLIIKNFGVVVYSVIGMIVYSETIDIVVKKRKVVES